MQRKIVPLLFALTWLLLVTPPAQAGYKLLHGPDSADPMQAHIYRLDNGLTVYLTENHEEPRFYAEIAVRAGSKHDPQKATGMAHYMEHMLFKGTDHIGTVDYDEEKVHLDRIQALYEEHFTATDPEERAAIYAQINQENQKAAQYAIPNELDRLYTAMGERGLNAHTWLEETVYKVDLPANRLEHWARIEAERFHKPVFRLFQTELETVYEEKNRSLDDKGRVIREAVAKQLYKKHPYRNTTLGSVEHLKNPSIKRMYDFYHTYYVPNNMAIMISGDIDIEETIALIDREFAVWESKKLPKQKKWKEPKIKDVERVEVTYEGEEYVLLAFRTAPQTHKDAEALQILDMILDNSVAGLINLNLNQQQQVRDTGSYPWLHNDYGAQYLWGIPKQGQTLEEVEQLLLDQIEIIKKGEFDEWIIPAIVTDFKKSYKQRLEGNGPRVSLMRDAFLSYEDWEDAVRTLDRMEKLTKKEIVKVANKYFGRGYVAGYRRDGHPELPSIEKPPLDKIDIDASRQSAFFKRMMELPYEEIEPVYVVPGKDFTTRQLEDGVKLYYARNPLNDLFSFSISIDVGTRTERRLAVAKELLDKSGTPRFSAEDLKKEWYKLGTDFSLGVGDQETTISISGLDENFASSLSLLVEFLSEPTTDDATLEELKQILLVKREDAKKDNGTVHQALYHFHRYGDDAYYRRIIPNAELQRLTRNELLNLIRSLSSYAQTIRYTGSMPLEKLLATLDEIYPLPPNPIAPPVYHVDRIKEIPETEIYFVDKEMAQALVRIDFGSVPFAEDLTPSIELYNEYFYGGMAGIVFQELREARALAYSAWAYYFTGNRKEDYNQMSGFIGTQADKTPEAIDVFVDLLDEMPVSPERFEAARRALFNKYRTERIGFRQVLGTVRDWERKKLSIDPRSRRFARLQQSDLDQVLAFQKEYIQGRPKLISIIGDRNKIDLEALAQHGKVVEIPLDDLFAF